MTSGVADASGYLEAKVTIVAGAVARGSLVELPRLSVGAGSAVTPSDPRVAVASGSLLAEQASKAMMRTSSVPRYRPPDLDTPG